MSSEGENDSKIELVERRNGSIEKASGEEALSQEKIQELDTAYRILSEIIKQNKSTCVPFMEKVDVEGLGLWDYENKVKEPMWLDKISEKFENGKYAGITEFTRDFRTMVENCYRYNGTDHTISKKAKRLEMAFEAKLALLRKEYRDKTDLSVTSDGKFAVDMNSDSLAPVSRYGRVGSTREYASVLDENSARLVYDFVRCEETMLQEDEKKASYRERRQQEILFQQMAAAWINSAVEKHKDIDCIKTCPALPEVALFLHLLETTLKFPELNMYQFERSILVPECSIYFSKIITTLLSSYQERFQLTSRPPMHFETWNNRLKERFVKWFEIVKKCHSYVAASEKIGVSVEFFQAFNWKNPFLSEEVVTFCDFRFDQKVQILKALCDSMFSLQIVQNALFSMNADQLQCMQLGKDFMGNVYIYFPQFCGDEVRVYRHREFGAPVPIDVPDQIWLPPEPPSSNSDSTEHPPLTNGYAINSEVLEEDGTEYVMKDSQEKASYELGQEVGSNKQETLNADSLSEAGSISTIDTTVAGSMCESEFNDLQSDYVSKEDSDPASMKSVDPKNGHLSSSQEGSDILPLPTMERRTSRVRKQTARYEDTSSFSQVKRSARKRGPAPSEKPDRQSNSESPKKRKKGVKQKHPKKESPVKYGNVDFEMLCDSVDAIQLLINKLQSEETNENKSVYGRKAMENHKELIDKLRWLYDELEPWNIKLQKARLSIQIQMKKEHNQIQNIVKHFDPWTEELSSKNTFVHGDNLTISHSDSPMSSAASCDEDEEDEDYISHSYFTRKAGFPKPRLVKLQIEEDLYEEERKTLLPAALFELEDILRDNINALMEVADRSNMQEGNVDEGRRTTRHKIKQQNKLVTKVLGLALKRTRDFPSLLPILVPCPDVYDVVDMILLEEETRLREIEEENRRKRLERNLRRQNSQKVKEIKIERTLPEPKLKISSNKPQPGPSTTISIRMQNGRICPATRLNDGRVIPIMRQDNTKAASSVEELIESTRKEVKKNLVNEIPTISLRCASDAVTSVNSPPSSTNAIEPGTATSNAGGSPPLTCSSSIVSVKRSPKKIIVTQPLQRSINPTTIIHSNFNTATGQSQSRPVTAVNAISRTAPVTPIILNGQKYSLVPGAPAAAMNQQTGIISAASPQPIPVILSQPTSVVRSSKVVLTPVQVVSPVRSSKPGGVVLLPVQNYQKTVMPPLRVLGPTPVLGVINSPQRQLQFQGTSEKSEP